MEDPANPSLGPNIKALGFFGLWRPVKTRTTHVKNFFLLIATSCFLSQYLKCIITRDLSLVKLVFINASYHLGTVKLCFFLVQHKRWAKVISYISSVERRQLSNDSETVCQIIENYVKKSRILTYLFWLMVFICDCSLFAEPYLKNVYYENGTTVYTHMYEWYSPFGETKTGYYISMAVETFLGNLMASYVVIWDAFVFAIMIFFAGQLEVTRIYCTQIVADTREETHKRIVNCHKFYTDLVKYQKLCKSLISPVMFIYLLSISTNLGLSIIKFVDTKNNATDALNGFFLLGGLMVQLLVFYWFGNEVTEQSMLVSYGVFESNWVKCEKKTLKEIALLAGYTTQRLFFSAGPFNDMTLATFVGILRISYSFYTLLNKSIA